mgnify:CR=1 FL=1
MHIIKVLRWYCFLAVDDVTILIWCAWIYIFFFQAEDGIRYLVRSRGLGDVYKRQIRDWFVANDIRPGHGGHHGGINKPRLVLPIQVITDEGEIITIETQEELRELRALCNPGQGGPGNGGPGHHGGEPCFTISFPLTVSFPDLSLIHISEPTRPY